MANYKGWTIAVMKERLGRLGLRVSGSKAELAARLLEHDEGEGELRVDSAEDYSFAAYQETMEKFNRRFEDAVARFETALDNLCHTTVKAAKGESLADTEEVDPTHPWYAEVLAVLERIAVAAEGISGSPFSSSRLAGQYDEPAGAPARVEPRQATREDVRGATRKLLTAQPDGRARALRVLNEHGGSVSSVPEADLGRCLAALVGELKALS